MIRTTVFTCGLAKETADALNRESGRVYTQAMVEHWRVYRQTGHWLSPGGLEKLSDFYDRQNGLSPLLHSHSVDAAQQGFPKACKTARACRKLGLNNRYPYRRKYYRTAIWKNTGIRKRKGVLLLSLSRGRDPIPVPLPPTLSKVEAKGFVEMRLVYNRKHHFYQWHAVVEDGIKPEPAKGQNVVGVDLGEVHPAAATDGQTAVVFSARALRALNQLTNKRLASFQKAMSTKKRNSRAWKRLQRHKREFLAKQKRRRNDIEHKVSRAVVDYAAERDCRKIAIGDVRDVADKVDKGAKTNQKISNWSHGKLRAMITYKAQAAGITVALVDEHYTTQTCPNPACMHRSKPRGRIYRCPACGFLAHRDVVGAANILSRHMFGELARIPVPPPKYRFAFRIHGRNERSPADTRHVACTQFVQEATGL